MRYTHYRAFEKHLSASSPTNFSPLYCLIIKDPAERFLAFDELRKKVGYPSLPVSSEEELLASLDSFSLFAKKQIFHFPCEKPSKSTRLEKRLSTLLPESIVVLSMEMLSRQTTFYKSLEKHGIILDTSEEKPWEKEKHLTEWLIERVHGAGKAMDQDAIYALAKGSYGSLARLYVEWEKLLTYVGELERITLREVTAICSLVPLDSAWLFGESMLAQKAQVALEVAHRMIDQGTAVFSILRGLRHQMTTALQLTLLDRDQAQERFPYLKGFMLEKQQQVAHAFGASRLIRALQIIDDFEFKAKDTWDDPKLLLTLLCARIL